MYAIASKIRFGTIIAVAILLQQLALAQPILAAWYNVNWGHRIKITIDSSKVDSDLSNFPIYVDLSNMPDVFFNNLKSHGEDIRVTNSGGSSELAREVVFIDKSNRKGELHFKADSVSSSSNTDFYIYYDYPLATEPAASSSFGSENVWNGYKAVWHFQQEPEANGARDELLDSTSNDHDGDSQGSMGPADHVQGKLSGKAYDFDGSNDYVLIIPDATFLNHPASYNFTVSAWAKSSSDTADDALFGYSSLTKWLSFYPYDTVGGDGVRTYWHNGGDIINENGTDRTGAWNHFALSSFGSTDHRVYVNGGLLASSSYNSPYGTFSAYQFWIGSSNENWTYRWFAGQIDEMRVSETVRSADWIKAEWNNQNSPATFYSLGSQEDDGADSTVPSIISLTPPDNGIAFIANGNLVIRFDDNIDIQSGNITINRLDTNTVVETVDVTNPARVTGNGSATITINPSTDLIHYRDYAINICAACFDDEAGNSFAGFSDNGTWSFSTGYEPDRISNLQLWLDPDDSDTLFDYNGTLLGSNTRVHKWSDKSGNNNFAIGSDKPTYISSDSDFNNKPVLSFDDVNDGMYTPLSLSAPYTVTAIWNLESIPQHASRAIQGSNNWLIGPYQQRVRHHAGNFVDNGNLTILDNSTHFTTALNTGTASTLYYQGSNNTGNSSFISSPGTINLGTQGLYSEPFGGNMGDVVIYNKALSNSERYRVQNYFSDKYNLGIGLTLDQLYPSDNGNIGYTENSIKMTFNREIDLQSGNINIYNSNGNIFESVDVSSNKMSGNGDYTIIISPNNGFVANASYYVRIDASAIDDISGKHYGGISNNGTWNFTTVPFTTNGLTFWLDANDTETIIRSGNSVSKWLDKSPSKQNAIQNSASRQPTFVSSDANFNNKPVISFDDANDGMGSLSYQLKPYTAVVVYNLTTIPQGLSRAVQGFNWNWLIGPYTGRARHYASGFVDPGSITISTNAPILDLATNTGSVSAFYHQGEDRTASPAATGSPGYIGLGASGMYGEPLGGRIAEVLFYNRVLSFTEQNLLESELAEKWNISIAPRIKSLVPPDDSTNAASNTNLIITFSQAVDMQSGNITLKKLSDNTTVENFDVTSSTAISGNGTASITINPSSDLENNTDYYVTVDASVFDDLSGKSFVGFSDNGSWNFKIIDSQAPVVTSLTPADNGTNIAITTNLAINFSEPIDIQTGNIEVKKLSDDTVIETIAVTSGQVSGNGSSAIAINTSTSLDNNTAYYVNIANTAFGDLNNNSYAGISDNGTWNFTTIRWAPPDWYDPKWLRRIKITVQASMVATDVVDFPVYVNLNDLPFSFFDYVKSDGSDIRVTKADGTTEESREVVFINTPSNGGELHFKVSGTLSSTVDTDFYIYYDNPTATEPAANSTYGRENVWNGNNYVAVYHLQEDPSGSAPQMLDSTKNDYDGTSAGTMNSADSINGQLSGKSLDLDGGDDYINLGHRTGLDFNYNQAYTLSVWTNGNAACANCTFYSKLLESSDRGQIYSYSATGMQQSFISVYTTNMIVEDFPYATYDARGSWHYVNATHDGSDDAAGYKLYINKTERVTTVANDTLSSSTQSSEPSSIGSRSTNPPSGFFQGQIDELRVANASRSAGWIETEFNNQNGSSSFYNPGNPEAIPPRAISFSPADNGTNIAVDTNLVITFNENVDITNGDISIYRTGGVLHEQIDSNSAQVTGNGSTSITINPAVNLNTGTLHYVRIDTGIFENSINGAYAGISDNGSWSFTTAGSSGPLALHYSPTDEALMVRRHQGLKIIFDRTVTKNTGNIYIKRFSDNAPLQTIDVTTSNVTVNDDTVTIKVPSLMATNTKVYIEIDSDTFRDLSAGSYGGITGNSTWVFTVGDDNAMFDID